MAETSSRLGSMIHAGLEKKGMEVQDLASAIGVEPGTMSAILSGEIARPPDARLTRIASALGLTFKSLRGVVGKEEAGGPGSLPIKAESKKSSPSRRRPRRRTRSAGGSHA